MDANNIDNLSIDELWSLYADIHDKLKDLGRIRSKNIVGDLGEQLVITYYNSTNNLPKLQLAPPSTKNNNRLDSAF